MRFHALKIGLVISLAGALSSCGGGKAAPSAGKVAQVTLSPSSISLIAGEVSQLSFSATNSTGSAPSPAPTFTFNSSNTKVATVSPSGLVCAGVWDSFFIVCNGSDAQGNPVAGTATITVSAGGVSSSPSQATVHPPVSSVVVDPVAGCFSIKQTHAFTAHACSTQVKPPDSSGPCAPNAKEITNEVGPFTWSSTTANVANVDTNGVATAAVPGLTGIAASVGPVTSFPASFRTCMPVQITLHLNGDPAGQPTEATTMAVSQTLTIEADMTDELGNVTNSAPVTIVSNNSEVAAVSGVTVTAESPGGVGLLAGCIPPSCGAGLNIPVYSNVFDITVNDNSPATFVYATTSFAPPSGTTPTMIPIDTSKSPIVAGTAINLPGTPNSLIFTKDGTKGYMGTSAGIASLDTTTNVVTLVDPFVGKALAVSPDGNTVILSNAASDPGTGTPIEPVRASQRLVIFTPGNNTVQTFVLPGAIAASFTADSSKAYVAVNSADPADNGRFYVFSTFQTLQTTTSLAPTPISDVSVLPGSAYTLFATSSGLQVVSTCNNAQQPVANNPPTNTPNLQLVKSVGNANIAVAVDTTGLDVVTATINSIFSTNPTFPFTLTPANCPPPVSYTNSFLDFGIGPFTARQLLVPTNGLGGNNGSHIVVLPVGMKQLLVATTSGGTELIPLAGAATEALSAGMTLDGNIVWLGAAGSNDVHEILLTNSPTSADALQISTSFQKSDGTAAPPNIVAVKPH